MKCLKYYMAVVIIVFEFSCQKTTDVPPGFGIASVTIVNAVPNSNNGIVPVLNTSQTIMWFAYAKTIYYGSFYEYSPIGGLDTVYAVQNYNIDTLHIGTKTAGQIFNNILNLEKGGIYSLFLCGSDTTSPDYLFTSDTIPYHGLNDSTTGIRFVNLSAGSNPISISLLGMQNGSEVASLPYKGITSFKSYPSNAAASVNGYSFFICDAATNDTLTTYSITSNNGIPGLTDPNYGNQITFRNITIALIGQPAGPNQIVPQQAILIDNY